MDSQRDYKKQSRQIGIIGFSLYLKNDTKKNTSLLVERRPLPFQNKKMY